MTTVGNFAKILNTNICDSFNISNFSNWTYPAIGKVQFNPESYTMLNSVIKNAYNLRPFPNSSNIVFNSFFNYKKLKHHAVYLEISIMIQQISMALRSVFLMRIIQCEQRVVGI